MMLNVEYQGPVFQHEAEDEELTQYRSLNRWALVSLLMGGMSWLALISPLLWIVGILAVLFGAVALRQIKTAPTQWTGGRMAVAGIVLACFFVSWAGARQISRQQAMARLARTHADQVLKLIQQGELSQVHQLTLEKAERAPWDADLEEVYQRAELERDKKEFLYAAMVRELVEAGARAEFRYQEVRPGGESYYGQDFEVVYRFLMPGRSPRTIIVGLRRPFDAEHRESNWRLTRIRSAS